MRLKLTIDQGEGEMPSDYASRLATRACRDDLWDFCRDFGINTQGLVDGRTDAVAVLAELSGVESEALLREAFVRTGKAPRYIYKGQQLTRHSLARERVHVCPVCVAEDMDRREFRLAARPHRRSEWVISAIRTCATHRVALVEIGRARSHDTSQAIAGVLPQLQVLLDRVVERAPSRFESYVRDRLAGATSSPWLDAFPLYAALQLALVVGAVSMKGRNVVVSDLNDNETWACEAEGFEILDRGEEGVKTFLDRLQSRFLDARTRWGSKAMFGRLYEWLARERKESAYDPMRDLVAKHFAEALPVSPDDSVFGRKVGERVLHSVRSASLEFGLHPKRMRKILREHGLICHESDGRSDGRVLFDADRGSTFLRQVADTLNLNEAARYLNIPRPHERSLLDRGFLRPMIRGGTESLKDYAFLRRDLDAFLAELLSQADASHLGDPAFVSIPRAAKLARCQLAEIVSLILDGTLRRIGENPQENGFLSVLVDIDEVRPQVTGPDHGCITMRQLERELRTSSKAVTRFVEMGLIAVEMVENPVVKRVQPVVRPGEVARFQREYVSLFSIAAERGVYFKEVKRELDAAGVAPVADPSVLHVSLYRRADIP